MKSTCLCTLASIVLVGTAGAATGPLEWIRPSDNGSTFVAAEGGPKIQLWGVNYDHDGPGRLIEDYWHEDWQRVVEDFNEIKSLGANSVRIHLQLAKFMESPEQTSASNLAKLADLIDLAEANGLYLIVTGLGCYHKQDVPPWYDALSARERWAVQARFWRAIAGVCKDSPAVFSYDLMNEPILPGSKVETDWLGAALGDKHFVQRISLDLAGRTRQEVAEQWVAMLTGAVREVDAKHMITVGVIPWALHFPAAKPIFYSPEVSASLDYVSVHFYPKKGKMEEALHALATYEIGKPLVIEEIFPLETGGEEVLEFINRSKANADGWVSFYWGDTIEDCEKKGDQRSMILAAWLKQFRAGSPELTQSAVGQ